MIQVLLDPEEIRFIKYVAMKRDENSKKKGRKNSPYDKDGNSERNNILGVAGEYAFCKRHNIFFDPRTELDDLPDYDCIGRNGAKIDIKTTDQDHQIRFVKDSGKIERVDYYVFTHGSVEDGYINIDGWMTTEELLKCERIENTKYEVPFFQYNVPLSKIIDYVL